MSMTFRRDFQLDALRKINATGEDHWFNDLLRCWTPSGVPSGTEGLRLAIRGGSLNLYRRGQSVAKVRVRRDGVPYLDIHWKYVTDRKPSGTPYLRLVDKQVLKSGRPTGTLYRGPATLRRWIHAAEKYAGEEKRAVDDIVAENGAVVDLEVGAPKRGIRVDLVLLERSAIGLRIVFWEAKRRRDSRLVSTRDPKVFKQIADYAAFLRDVSEQERISTAYRKTCELLLGLHEMAKKVQPRIAALDDSIIQASEGAALTIDVTPRLVIVDDGKVRQSKDWPAHLSRLREVTQVAVLPHGGPFALPRGGTTE
jgi:hypothetical protein